MKERPILFSAPMVRALLDGRKTMTRRIAKPVKHPDWGNLYEPGALVLEHEPQHVIDRACPYGQPGDRLWVQEPFRFPVSLDERSPTAVGAMAVDAGYKAPWCPIQYEADLSRNSGWAGFETPPVVSVPGKLRQDRHMPRWASRILLEIVSVQIERLQSISEIDAIAEGAEEAFLESHTDNEGLLPSDQFFCLWDQIYGLGAWEKNPWVWVVEFKRIDAAH